MESEESKIELEHLKEELKTVTKAFHNLENEDERTVLFNKQQMLNERIWQIEWTMKSPEEKQEFRRSVIGMGRKWNTMRGTIKNDSETKSSYEFIVELYDLSVELLKFSDLSNNVKKQIQILMDEINLNRVP